MSSNQVNPAVQLRSETTKLPVIRGIDCIWVEVEAVHCIKVLSPSVEQNFCDKSRCDSARMPSTSMTSVTFEGQRYGAGNWMSGYQEGGFCRCFSTAPI